MGTSLLPLPSVLIVDDEPDICTALGDFLKHDGGMRFVWYRPDGMLCAKSKEDRSGL